MNKRITIKHWAISLVILGGGMSACADGTSWKEEMLLHDGKRLSVERSAVRIGRQLFGDNLVTDLATAILASETQAPSGSRGDWRLAA